MTRLQAEIRRSPAGPGARFEMGLMARDFYDRELRVGSAVEVLSGEDMNSRAKVVSVQGEYVLVELPDGATLRLLGRMVQLMETKMAIGHLPPAGNLADGIRTAQAKLREAREWLKAARNAYMKNPSQETAAPATALAKQVKALEEWLESVGANSMERMMEFKPGDKVKIASDAGVGAAEGNVKDMRYGMVRVVITSGSYRGDEYDFKPEYLTKMDTSVPAQAMAISGYAVGATYKNDATGLRAKLIEIKDQGASEATYVIEWLDGPYKGQRQEMSERRMRGAFSGPLGFDTSAPAIAFGTRATCPYCVKTLAMDYGPRLPAHRAPGGVCLGAEREVACLDSAGRAVFAQAVEMGPGYLKSYTCPLCGHTVSGRVEDDGKMAAHEGRSGQPCAGSNTTPAEVRKMYPSAKY